MDSMEKELWDAFYGKTNSQKRCAVLREERERYTHSEERNLYSGYVEPADQWFYEDMVEYLLNERGASFYIFDRNYSGLTSVNEKNNRYEASSEGFK